MWLIASKERCEPAAKVCREAKSKERKARKMRSC